ncbi:hypothetical protein CVD28_14730 [Bacillus sp. M6-12]|uniref:hypothetical protein n=1 Tax=Bacillus sp. M6-12 TaxID=2054166 RepID=UPI000C75FBF1|nr:hypothetical protein [Bacillus sp. M6-12]PLS16907.1 hypothetical protein CVD28_14730 [Bacillus sp. M6-12]
MEEFVLEAMEIGDTEALLDDIMKMSGQDVLRLAYSYAGIKTAAEDLTQEISLNATGLFVMLWHSKYGRKAALIVSSAGAIFIALGGVLT